MSPNGGTEPLATNTRRLPRVRLGAVVMPAAANRAVATDGRLEVLPGQGGVVLGIELGDRAGDPLGDHVEPGLSLGHPEPAANRAIQVLTCVGNSVRMADGLAQGAEGIVYGKHGLVLAALPQAALERITPGDRVAVEAVGTGLAVEGEPEIACLSLAPCLLDRWAARDAAGRVVVPVRAVLPTEAAAAGIGMPSNRYNMDLHSDQPPSRDLCADLGFGDLVAILDQDHRFGRCYRKGWITFGVIAHGRTVAGGHGLGFASLLTGPCARFEPVTVAHANVAGFAGSREAI